jgi:hypothetical protein
MKRQNLHTKRPFLSWASCILITLIVLLLNACNSKTVNNDIGDGGLITEKPCSPPCFLGIIPDTTTKDQVVEMLKQKGFSEYKQIGNILSYGNSIDIKYDSKEYVNTISFVPTTILTTQVIIEKYGPPNMVEVVYDTFSTPEHNYFSMGFYYDQLQTYIKLENQEIYPAYSLGEDTKIEHIVYYNEGAYKNAKSISKHSVQWKGYGSYVDPAP